MESEVYVQPTMKFRCPQCDELHVVVINIKVFKNGQRFICNDCDLEIKLKAQ